MGSHGGATDEGQAAVLARYGITPETMGCEVRSSMQTIEVCTAAEGFTVHFDRNASTADHVLVVNRVKSHTRFCGPIESGLMKMMLIGLGKQRGAEVYHRAIMNYSFDQIVRSVARETISRCRIVGGLAILENGYEETAELVGVQPQEIEQVEPTLLKRVQAWAPKLPVDRLELLIVDEIGKEVSGAGMDTNVIGRKFNDHCAIGDERPNIRTIYVRGLTKTTHGNATGIGISEMCHRRVVEEMDVQATRMNCLTGGHMTLSHDADGHRIGSPGSDSCHGAGRSANTQGSACDVDQEHAAHRRTGMQPGPATQAATNRRCRDPDRATRVELLRAWRLEERVLVLLSSLWFRALTH